MSLLRHPRTLGLVTALAMLAVDQGNKLWLLFSFDIATRQPVPLGPFMDVVLAKNPGISYSLVQSQMPSARVAAKVTASSRSRPFSVLVWNSE